MFSQEERKRLENRDSKEMDSQIRASNDSRVRRKLKRWLEKDLNDVSLALNKLPDDQLRRVIGDKLIFCLLDVALEMARVKEFAPLHGKIDNPANWKAGDKDATDVDIKRAAELYRRVKKLNELYGSDDLIGKTETLIDMSLKGFQDRITEKEKCGMERIAVALSDHPL